MENTTPMLRQYLEIKEKHPGTILFFRLGDFYEMFNEDAILASKELEITLTARHKDSPNPIPMCGVPHHSAAGYISRLVRKGFRVAICEQAEEAGKGTKLVRREVVRIITPGTVIDSQLLDPRESVFLATIDARGDKSALAVLDLSTGEFLCTESEGADAWQKIVDQLRSFQPREILYATALEALVADTFRGDALGGTYTLTPLDSDFFDADANELLLKKQFGVKELSAFEIDGRKSLLSVAGAALRYARETQRESADHIDGIKLLKSEDFLVLDPVTLRNLEILQPIGESKRRTLMGVLDETVTGMGSRTLRSWLTRPLLDIREISGRQDAVDFLRDSIVRDGLRSSLADIYDLERLVGRLNLGVANARDLLALGRTLRQTPVIKQIMARSTSSLLRDLETKIDPLPDLVQLIENAISDEPPINIGEGGTIRGGFDSDLDQLRSISNSGKQVIARFEEDERIRTGISSLKVKFNNVFGYFIEISKSNLAKVPDDYVRKQTLANAERFTTPDLKEWEQKVLGAEERILQLEIEIFNRVRNTVRERTNSLITTARSLAATDALCAFAEVAVSRRYTRPELHPGDALDIKGGRHPVVEVFLDGDFVPNDVSMNNSSDRLIILTGPNMGGKSTILRQIALMQVMAQAGCFVPAEIARLPIVDRVWTRVGASDDLASGRSTFMVEMTETATILLNATPRSLVLLDEIGRGTSTFDGLSIAWAVAEFMHNSAEHSAKTIFATHYHELTELESLLPGVKNYEVTAKESGSRVVFLHRMQRGKASQSYGIAVAKLAGIPQSVIDRAKEVLARLEEYELAVLSSGIAPSQMTAPKPKTVAQIPLFGIANEAVIDDLRNFNPSNASADELREFLNMLQRRIV
jgi:DNA mismatch repair protein MutS